MIDSGMATVQYHVAFAEQRLGMMLADAADGDGVEVVAFTEADGQLGPAELSGQVAIGDKVARVGGTSTRGLGYAAVLDMVIDAPRPVTIHFERKGARPQGDPARILHEEWRGPPPPDGGAGGGGEPE
jgi:C-terminal processing protease CtpA/Prc